MNEWRRLALAALRRSGDAGDDTTVQDVDDLLATVTYDGMRIAVLYTADDPPAPPTGLPGQFPYVRGARPAGGVIAGWDVRQHHDESDPDAVRQAVLDDLENGATSIWLEVGDGSLPVEALPDALDGVYLDLAGVTLEAGAEFVRAGQAWFDLLTARSVEPGKAFGGLGADPLGWQARTGEALGLPEAAWLAGRCVAEAPGLRAITVDATVFHDAGARTPKNWAARPPPESATYAPSPTAGSRRRPR